LTPEATLEYNEIAIKECALPIDSTVPEQRLFRFGIDPIYIRVLEKIPNASPHCTPQIFEIPDAIVAESGIDLATSEYPGRDLYRLLTGDDSSDEESSDSEDELPLPEVLPAILTAEEASSYRARVRYILTNGAI
jgi:hypothetical protein